MLDSTLENRTRFHIREMESADIPRVRELAERIWRKHYVPEITTLEQIDYMLARIYSDESMIRNRDEKQQRFWLLYDADSLIAYTAVEPKAKGAWFIDKLYVDMDTQRKGLGTILLNHITHELRPVVLTLRVNRKNFKAINFYFKHGFFIEAMDILDIGNGYVMDDFLMKKIL